MQSAGQLLHDLLVFRDRSGTSFTADRPISDSALLYSIDTDDTVDSSSRSREMQSSFAAKRLRTMADDLATDVNTNSTPGTSKARFPWPSNREPLVFY